MNSMRFSNPIHIHLLILVLSLLQIRPTFAVQKPYIVYLGSHSDGRRYLAADPQTVTRSHHDLLFSVLQSHAELGDRLIYSYNKIFDGFAAVLHEEEAKELEKHPNVVSVFESENRKIQTTRSWDFLGLEYNLIAEESTWNKDHVGEDIIIATLDTGVWPESKSFTEEGFGPIPKKFKGSCDNENNPTFQCNRKLIGARYFFSGYAQDNPTFNSTKSPRDTTGHGTNTLSIAAGNFVPGANFHEFANGTAKGGSPRARVVSYKVCWSSCNEADVLAGFEAAIDDDVDIISMSLGSPAKDYILDPMSIGAFYAVKNDIIVIAGGGNNGPQAETISNVSPWILTVGASTIDREITSHVTLGNKQNFKGASLLRGASIGAHGLQVDSFYPLISGADANNVVTTNTTTSLLCKPGTLDPMKVQGKILVCLFGEEDKSVKAIQAVKAGAVAMILANNKERGYTTLPHAFALPAVNVNYRDSLVIFNYINSTRSPVASLTQSVVELGINPAPVMASFSSRGPNRITPEILKPDITAPGVSILAANSEDSGVKGGPSHFRLVDGTSISCPHVSGIAGRLKKLHRDWSPSAIKSAIMTTASPHDNTMKPIRDSDMSEATPFAYGSGNVIPTKAMDPGLVYDMNHHDYLNFLCAIGYSKEIIKKFSKHSYYCPQSVSISSFNYPSIVIPNFLGQATITRRLKNVGPPSTYSARIEAPVGVSIIVEPNTLMFATNGQEREYKLKFTTDANQHPGEYSFGSLVWSDGKHIVRSPIAVKGKL